MRWQSPYQTRAYSRCLALAGVETLVRKGPPQTFFDRLTTRELTAWETSLDPKELHPDGVVYDFDGFYRSEGVNWRDEPYCTLVVELDSPTRYAPELRRNLKKAVKSGLRYEPLQAYGHVAALFERDELRAMLPVELFERTASSLIGECADVHTATCGGEAVAGAVVLRSAQVANFRFVGSNQIGRSLQAGAFLYDRMVAYYREVGLQFVDLSGLAPPASEEGLRRVNAFKTKFTNLAAVFRKHTPSRTPTE